MLDVLTHCSVNNTGSSFCWEFTLIYVKNISKMHVIFQYVFAHVLKIQCKTEKRRGSQPPLVGRVYGRTGGGAGSLFSFEFYIELLTYEQKHIEI